MISSYYDDLAQYYKYIYPDWEKSMLHQGSMLAAIIQEYFGDKVSSVLDVACGIGTQCIGLAKQGYQVTASDISSTAVEQGRKEARKYGVNIRFNTADMSKAWDFYHEQFDLLIACDNSIPHLLSEDEILAAFRQFYQCVKPEGGCLISVRDYANLNRESKDTLINPRLLHQIKDEKVILFDVWDFSDDYYEFTTYIIHDKGKGEIETHAIRGGKYFCVEIPKLVDLFYQAGFRHVDTLPDRFFQPLLIATK